VGFLVQAVLRRAAGAVGPVVAAGVVVKLLSKEQEDLGEGGLEEESTEESTEGESMEEEEGMEEEVMEEVTEEAMEQEHMGGLEGL